MENININETEPKTDKPSIETLSTINKLDKEFLNFTKRPDLDANPDATFKWLDDWTEKRFGLKGERGSVWQKDRTAYSTPREYARALTGLLNRGYEAIATPEYNALIAAEKANNRDEIIKLGNISLEKREAYVDAYGLPIGTHIVKKTDEEIDKEIKEYTAKVKSQNFAAHFLTFADDFTPQEKDIVYASLRYGDGLPAEKEADYLAVWRENPEKAARLDYLIKLSRKNEYTLGGWGYDTWVHPLVTGLANIYHGVADEVEEGLDFASVVRSMKQIVTKDGERRTWNDEERKLYRDLVDAEKVRQSELGRRNLGGSALVQTFSSPSAVANPREYVDSICARRMAREALPREEQLKRRKEQLMLRLATSHQPYDDYDPVSNAISGAIGSVPYMAVAAVPYVGIAANTLAQFGNVRNDIILNGGNPDDAVGAQLLSAGLYMAIEKQQFLTFSKPLTGLQKKAILNRIAQTAWKNGKLGALGEAIRQGAPEFIAKTFAECVEEGLQGAVEGGTKQWWMPEEKGGGDWTKTISAALKQGGQDFIDSIGTMGVISIVGSGINQTQARRNALSVESVIDYAGKKMQVMNIMTGRVKEMADNKDAPANAQKMLNEITQIWQAHKGNAVAALDEMREKYSLTDAQARTVGDYLDLESTLLNIARTSKTDEEANAIAAFAGGAYRVGQTTGKGDTAYDVVDLFRMISPNITVEDIEVDDMTKAPVASPTVENLRQERDAALKRIEEAKVGSQRKAAERELRRINKKLKAAEANENAVSYPKMTMRRVTIPVGKRGETRSFVIREDNEAPDIHGEGYAQSAVDAVKGAEGLKAGEKVSLQEFKALPLEQKLDISVTQEQYMAMSNEERAEYVSHFNLGGSGNFALLDNTGKEIFNSDAIVSLFRGKVGTPGARIGGNWTLAHEYTHGVVRFLRDIDAIDEGTVALMRRLFGEPTSDNELWNEEAMANGFAEFLRGEFDFRRLTPEERREAMGFFERVWDIIKNFFRRFFGAEIDEPPVVASKRKEAERAVFNALRNGDLSGLDQYAGIEFEEEVKGVGVESASSRAVEEAQEAQKAAFKPSEEKTTNESPKTEKRAPRASKEAISQSDETSTPKKAETTPEIDIEAVVEQVNNPIATAANLPARTNTKMTIFTPGYEMEIECEMMWVPLNELAESTDDREVQMRDRSRRATDEQVRSKTRKGVFQPLALFPGKKSDDGAPIVGGGMKIISGHGRKRMLEQLASEGRFNEYLSAINAEAQRQSVPTAPEGMKNPVLVLRVTGGLDKKSDLNRFAELSNRWGGLERSGAELAESDARKITDALLRLYNPDASGNLLAASNRQFMAAFLKEVGATGLTNADGTPTPEAALRVQRALMTAIFGNDEKIRAIIQNLLEKSGELSLGNLTNALMRSAGKLLAMKRAKGSFDIVNDVREAAYHYIAWRSAQQKQKSLSFADYLSEQDMFAEVATPMQAALAKLLEVGRFGTVLDEYSKLVAQEAVDAQGSFDFAEKRTPLQLLGYAERNTLAAEETPVTPDPTSAEAAEPVQTPPVVSEEEREVKAKGEGEEEETKSSSVHLHLQSSPITTAQAVITPPEPETFTPAPLVRGTATLPGPGAEGIKAHQVNANGEPTTRVKTLPAGAWNLLRAPYDVRRPPKASAQDKAGRGLKISNPPPANWNGIFPHFQGNKTEMADRTSQAIRANMTKAEREHYTTVVDYFGGGGCWGLFHALANFPNAKTLVINEFDPDRLGKIRLLQEIDGELANIAYKLLDERYEEIREAAKDSSSPSTIANVVESQFKRLFTDPTERAAIQAFIDCAHTLLATSKDAQGNAINDTRLGIRRAIDTLREDGRKAKESADAFKAREGATIRYVSGDAVANADTLPHGDDVMAIADPPYYLTADYQQNTILGLEKVPDNWSYRATQEFLHKLVDSGDGLVYTDEAWWFKEAYNPDQQEDLFGGGSTFAKEQEILLDIINTLDHFDVAGRVVGRQEVLGVHHGHKINARTENGENSNAVRPDAIDNAGGGLSAGSPVLGVAAEPQGQGGRDGTAGGERGLNGERASVIASGRRAIAREVIIQDIAASIESAATEIAQGAAVDTDAISRLVRYSVRQVREERMADYAQFVSKNAKSWLRNAAKRLDKRMKDSGYTEKVWHGTYGEDFNVFKFSANSHDVPAAYFTYKRGTAQNYAALRAMDYDDEAGANTRQFYVNPGKVLDLDEGENPSSFEEFIAKLQQAYEDGYNAVRVKNALDDQGVRLDENDENPTFTKEDDDDLPTDILIVMQQPGDNAQARIKAADAVTFDDDGLPIPLEMCVDQSMSDIRFSVQMGKKAREEARRMIEKYRPGLHGFLTNFNGVLMPQDDAAINSIAAFETPKERKAALLWFCKDAIRLPEDAPKVTEAIKTAERAKVDPMQYDRPGDILEKFSEFRPKEPPINPDTVPELSDKRDMGSGVTTYLVQDDKAGQLAMRKIINTHWGKDANPWCLLQGDGEGNLSDGSNGRYNAWHYWQHYNALPKRVAFQDGKLLAFMATNKSQKLTSLPTRQYDKLVRMYETETGIDAHDKNGDVSDAFINWYNNGKHQNQEWWDRADKSHEGIPMRRVTKGESEYGASTTTETIELMPDGTEVPTGKKRESIAPDGTRTEEIWGDGGNADRYDCNIHYPSGVREEKTIGRNITKTTFSTVTDNLLEATSMQYSNSLAEEITWWHDNYTHYRLNTTYRPNTKNSAYVLYKYERGAFRETDVEYMSDTVNAWRTSAEAALRRGEAIPPLPESDTANTPRFSVTITRPWRKDFPNATVMTTRKAILEKHGDLFTKAKAGDVEAAADLIDTLMADKKRLEKVRELKRRHPKAAFVAAVHAEEATGRNKIPYSFAKFIAKTLGIKTTDSIVQTVRAEHSGADAWHRLTHRAQFTGVVESGKEYILVDDHITQGGTLNELRSYIENEGGKVVDIIALTSSKGSTILVPKKETIDELKTRYPDINRLLREADIAGRVEALTNSEAEYIKTFSPDTFRDRIAQAGSERGRRLFGEALGEPPSDSVARTEWSETPEERHHVRRGRTPRNIDDTLTSYVAAQIMGGTDVTIEDMRKIVSSASSGTRAADILERAKTLANDNRAKAVAKAASSAAELSHRLGDMLETDRLNKALSDAVTMGAKAANPETGRKLQQAIERKRIRDLQAAEGFTAAEIMAELPIDLGEAVLAAAERERTPEELAKLEEARKQREEERKKKLETEEGAEELADEEAPMRDPTEAERKAVDDLLDRARIRDDLQREEEERKRAEKAKRDAAEAEGGESEAESDSGEADDRALLPEDTVRRIAPVFESADVFSWFIIELTGDKTLEKHPELPSTGEMWKSPVAVRELKKTAADILRRLAKDTLGSPSINYARNYVDRAINELESDLETKTFNSVRRKIARIYTMIWDNAHRITKNELMKELEKTVSKLTQKGRFSYTQEEMDRDIPAKIERWAKWVLKYARMGEAKLQDEIANLEKLTSENPASEDGKMPTPIELAEAADKLAVAKVYGHLKGKTIGEMRDLIDQIAAKLDGERQAFELRRAKIEEANKTIVDALVNALTQGKANRRNKAKAKGIVERAMESMISSIDQQMVDLVRFCTDAELRKKALEAIDELTILINEGGNRYRNTLATAQEEIHDGLKACYGSAEKGIRHLHEKLPPEIVEQFFRQSSDKKRTYGHLLQLYASCLQRDYAENVRKHGRDKQIAAMEAALTAQDKMFHTWAVNWYKHNRQALSDAVEEVTGLPVIAPDELYVPVRVETEPSGIPAEVVAWSPVPRALNRRVRHSLDFDENAHFLSMVNEQAEIRAQTIGYAMTGIILRDTIASRDVQTAARRNASPSDMNAVITHLRDILAQDVGKERSDSEIVLKFLRRWAARFNIAWNPSSALAQPASIPVWANVLLDGEAWGATSVLKAMASAATEEGRAAIAELRASDGYRARYKLGWSEEVANVYANPNEPKLLSKLGAAYDKGMILSQFTDAACSLWIAQGFYRHATDVFVRRGETIEEAKRKALALTWAAVEQTQQSGRTENLSAIQRARGKNWVNAALQFKTAQILQNSYIIRAYRDVRAGVPGAKGRLLRAIFISTVWVPGYLSLKGALWALIMGVKPEPDDEDKMPLWFREMLYSAADGMTAPLFVTSLFVEKPLREMFDLKSYPRRTGFASIDTIKRLAYDTYDLITDPIMLEEELTSEKIIDDIWKVIGDTFAPARHVRKAINNRRED